VFSRALFSIVVGASLLGALVLTGCSALTRPDEISIVAEPIGSPKPEPAPAAPGALAPGGAAVPAPAGTG